MEIKFNRQGFENNELVDLYKAILLPRLVEERMLILLRQGRISKWFAGIGQEAIAVGVTKALEAEEYILPMHRNLGVFTTRDIPLRKLFSQFQGKDNGFTKGRDRSFHFGTQDYNIVGMISHLGPQLAVADGIALANLLENNKKTTAVFTGDGGTSEGDFHESLNVAAVWDLPVIFVIENNGYGLSTPTSEQYRCKDLADRAVGYGMESRIVDGNNILEVYKTIKEIKSIQAENPQPFLVEFKTFRRRGHEEASGTKYVPQDLMDFWEKKDPVNNFETFLLEEEIISSSEVEELKKTLNAHILSEWQIAYEEEAKNGDIAKELADVYAPYTPVLIEPKYDKTENIRMVDAISKGLQQAMEKHDDLVIMGQDIAEYGGVFKITDGFIDQFGKERVRNTPICESAIVSAGLGLSINGKKAVMEMQFSDFVSSGFNPIVNNLAKSHYRWEQNADVVVRMPCGAGVGAGPFHSQTNEAWFTKTPGLKVVYPSSPSAAKGLLIAAIEDPNPVMFFEHKALYRSSYEDVPVDYYNMEIGKAHIVQEGDDLSIITYGMGVVWAKKYVEKHPEKSIEILDLQSLVPLDKDAVLETVKKTNKVVILHEDSMFSGIGGELSALIAEECFEYLDAPIKRVASLDTPIPFAASLEKDYLANSRLDKAIEDLMEY
ncbi:MAG: dehydrogenase E1 component subunit alpha/beta [Flavobacteriales bacterium]|jgi:2-oxoisovalerate dehydrogenase E1 component|nr:dehydrogenase E1 component subunit alpha/beta [Flavobacteriales bacterium]